MSTIVPGGISAKYKYPVWQTVEQYKDANKAPAPAFNSLLLGKFVHDAEVMTLDVVRATSPDERDAYITAGYRKIIKPWVDPNPAAGTTLSYLVLAVARDLHTLLVDKDGRPYHKLMKIPAWLGQLYNMPEQDILRGVPTEQNTITLPTPLHANAPDERFVLRFNTAMIEKVESIETSSQANVSGGIDALRADLAELSNQIEVLDAKVSLLLASLAQK